MRDLELAVVTDHQIEVLEGEIRCNCHHPHIQHSVLMELGAAAMGVAQEAGLEVLVQLRPAAITEAMRPRRETLALP